MKRTKKSTRNLTTLEADRDLAQVITRHAKQHNLKIYRVTSDVILAGLKVKRLLPSQMQDTDGTPKVQG